MGVSLACFVPTVFRASLEMRSLNIFRIESSSVSSMCCLSLGDADCGTQSMLRTTFAFKVEQQFWMFLEWASVCHLSCLGHPSFCIPMSQSICLGLLPSPHLLGWTSSRTLCCWKQNWEVKLDISVQGSSRSSSHLPSLETGLMLFLNKIIKKSRFVMFGEAQVRGCGLQLSVYAAGGEEKKCWV